MGFKSIRFRFLSGTLVFLGLLSPLGALDLPVRKIEDDSSLRFSLKDSWFTEMPARTLAKKPQIHTLPGGSRVQVRAEAGKNEFMVILAREWNGFYPYWSQGSWVITRRKSDGAAVRISAFLKSDPNIYVQFRPYSDNKSLMDVVIYNAYALHSLPIALPFPRLLEVPLGETLKLAGDVFPARYFETDPAMYRELLDFMALLRERLPELSFRDDGAIDETGRYVFINTLKEQDGQGGLNCSGFAKWVVDGILRPVTGKRLEVNPLKEPSGGRHSSLSKTYDKLRDPFFGLDWTRNLASAALRVLRSPELAKLEEIEVRNQPFASVITRTAGESSVRSYPGFLLNAGFGFEGLQPLLYTLAVDEPGRIYLASINTELDPAPRMRQHFHVAVLVPYFNEYGNFTAAVFESAGETSFNNFKNRYPGHYINLVRIPVEPAFDP
jgi:hypothetical protein